MEDGAKQGNPTPFSGLEDQGNKQYTSFANWSPKGELNTRSFDYRSNALSQLSYSGMVPETGFEPVKFSL